LHQLKQFCAESGLETYRAKCLEICLTAIYLLETAQIMSLSRLWQVMKFV